MSTNTQGGYRIGTVKGRNPSEDRAMSPDLIDRAALRAAVNRIPLWSPHPDIKDSVSGKWTMAANDVLAAIEGAAPRAATGWADTDTDWGRHYDRVENAPRAATEPDWERLYVEESARYARLSNQMTRERLAAALYEALNATRVGPDYPESLELADAILAALATPPSAQETE